MSADWIKLAGYSQVVGVCKHGNEYSGHATGGNSSAPKEYGLFREQYPSRAHRLQFIKMFER
jgi:hypothetical protein